MTLTYFFGTITYCSEEMQNIFAKYKQDFVDLYFNDVYGLNKIFLS